MSAYLYMGSGPLWIILGSSIVGSCNKYWWTNAIFINNIYPWENSYHSGDEQCLPWFWYISTEFQFFFIGLILIWLYSKSWSLGIIVLSVLLALGIIIPGLIPIINQSIISLPQFDSKSYSDIFTKPWARIFVLALGVGFGFIVAEMNIKKESKISKYIKNMNILHRIIWGILGVGFILAPSLL